ncbi:hypothetical protein A8L45_03580 [Veronia pacifica]|uniref:N-acetyltransferase domain-containing protein n=1 Tax=Veronia pacifica TaxID=1080227 RepID=A0A1C3ER85_9GAMM|nr:hypothetical protein A8L45_03580 [Veronia pacifica]
MSLETLSGKDIELHKEFIYVALWDAPDEPRRPRDSVNHPKVAAYYNDWGQPHDLGVIAYVDGNAAGFIQSRIKESVTVDYANYPELVIAVMPLYQGKGIGSQLFKWLLAEVRHKYPGIRLGVNPKNKAAIALYKRFQFEFYAQPEGAYPQMVVKFD